MELSRQFIIFEVHTRNDLCHWRQVSRTQESILLDQPREVDVVSVERELTLLWKAAVEEGGSGEGVPVVRACSLNLVVVTEDPARLTAIEQLIGDVTVEHPARIFLILADPISTVALLDAWIAARCSLPAPGEKQVCCEQITLNARGPEVSKIPSVVASLLVPDIPTVLLWKAPIGQEDPVLGSLAEMADRVLIDSSEDPEPLKLLRSMRTSVVARQSNVLCGDLAWSHITPWRSALAQAFKPEQTRQFLSSISSVDIGVSSSTHPPHNGTSQALLLLGWLASRLGWSVLQPAESGPSGSLTALFGNGRAMITTTVIPRTVPLEGPGGLEEVRIGLSDIAELLLVSGDNRSSIHTRLIRGTEPGHESIQWVRDRDEASVIARELEGLDRDELYESAGGVLTLLLGTV
jgi:glucose-6-phosphate dehydrogenase assembly protein OpcA